MRVGIVGLGLMGGSLGLALKELDYIQNIYGYDHNTAHTQEALELGLVEKIITYEELIQCDIIILAIPVDAIINFLNALPPLGKNQLVIDLGSTKSKIVANTPENLKENFIPAHPMTGTEKFGPTAALNGLYKNKNMVLCDLEGCGEFQKDIAIKIFEDIGMRIIQMNSKSHDEHAAFISHMPHIVSYSLANTVLKQENPQSILSLAAGGFKDMSRIAKSSPDMWGDIFEQNAENVLESIRYFENELKDAKRMIENKEWEDLRAWMSHANNLHEIF